MNDIFLFSTARGEEVVGEAFKRIQAREPVAWASIRTQLEILKTYGPVGSGFNQLRHVGTEDLWELRAQGRPAYRVLFAPLPGEQAFVLLIVVPKDEMTKQNLKNARIAKALDNLDDWANRRNTDDS